MTVTNDVALKLYIASMKFIKCFQNIQNTKFGRKEIE